ncbi:phospholipid transport system substrate-binding protein [Gammaproteobacteria bacterium]
MQLTIFRAIFFCFTLDLFIATPLIAKDAEMPQPAAGEKTGTREEVLLSPEIILQNGIVALTEQFKQDANQEKLLAFLQKEIAPHFDLGYMTRLSAGIYWNALDEQQKKAFEEHFQHTFFQALVNQVSNLGNPQIRFYPARPGANANEITVSARVTQPQGIPILMDFRFYRGDQGWKIFDVMADGSSAVLYYRRFYAELVNHYGVNALLGSD